MTKVNWKKIRLNSRSGVGYRVDDHLISYKRIECIYPTYITINKNENTGTCYFNIGLVSGEKIKIGESFDLEGSGTKKFLKIKIGESFDFEVSETKKFLFFPSQKEYIYDAQKYFDGDNTAVNEITKLRKDIEKGWIKYLSDEKNK
jgi:hypothetical protein